MANDETTTALACRDSLERLLDPAYRITEETDVEDFLLLTGFSYRTSRAYQCSVRPDLQAALRVRHSQRWAEDRRSQTRIRNALSYGYRSGWYRTIEDLRAYIAIRGQHHQPTLNDGQFTLLNKLFAQHSIAPVIPWRVRGHRIEEQYGGPVPPFAPSAHRTRWDSLEAVFAAEDSVGPETDVLDFLLIAGVGYRCTPAYLSSHRTDLQIRAQHLHHLRNPLPGKKRHSTAKYNFIRRAYEQGEFRTLGEAARSRTPTAGDVCYEISEYYRRRDINSPNWT